MKIRLIISSDRVPPELKRIIEFLNDAAVFDIFGIEVQLFATKDSDYKILAPHLVGFTETVKERKQRSTQKWDYDRFFEALGSNASSEIVSFAEQLYNFGKEVTGRNVEWGVGTESGSFTAKIAFGKNKLSIFSVNTYGITAITLLMINRGWVHIPS